MRALAALALCSGCATSWIITQAADGARILDEGVREVRVPVPGVQEKLSVSLPLAFEYATLPGNATASTTPSPFQLTCRTEQRAKDVVYHSAFRYGSKWKLSSGVMFLVEAALAAVSLAAEGKDKAAYQLGGAVLAADALVTAGLFFIPRKEIYRHDEATTVTPVRSDCPDGMSLAVGTEKFPVDAAGRLGEVGDAALDAWMRAPTSQLVLEVAGQQQPFQIGYAEQCVWMRTHHPDQPNNCTAGTALRSVMTLFDVPVGTLSGIAGL